MSTIWTLEGQETLEGNYCVFKFPKKKKPIVFCYQNCYRILLPKLFWPTVRINCSCDREKVLKFETEGWEFAKVYAPKTSQNHIKEPYDERYI